jgi:hypothetical protein
MPPARRRDPAAVDGLGRRGARRRRCRCAAGAGDLALAVRGLAERLAATAPGHHVEVRVPPYSAVQCVEGPRHTRGTPPNVVEVEPLAFVQLCAGRLAWSDAVRDGRARTWGDRADLSGWLPLPR